MYSQLPDICAQLPSVSEILDLPLIETLTLVHSSVSDVFYIFTDLVLDFRFYQNIG